MKKIMIVVLLVVACTLAFAVPAFAGGNGAVKVEGVQAVGDINGFMIYNEAANGNTDISIQIQIRDGAPSFTYVVYSNYVFLGEITTNVKGSGGTHINLGADAAELGAYVNVRIGTNKVLRFPVP